MVDNTQPTETPAVAPATPDAAPSIPAPVESPVETPVSAPVSEPVTIPQTDVPATEVPAETVLGASKPKDGEVKADVTKTETKPEGEIKTETAPEVKVELPVYEPFKLPENLSVDKEPMDAFSKILGEVETGKLDHAGYQEAGQKLIDLAVKNTQQSIERLNDYYVNIHETQKKDWFEAFKKDPEMGGEKLQETFGLLCDIVDNYGGSPAQIAEFRQVMKDTGVGNHPAVTRILYNMAQKINKYTTESDNGNGGKNRMVPGARPAPSRVKDFERFYGGNAS